MSNEELKCIADHGIAYATDEAKAGIGYIGYCRGGPYNGQTLAFDRAIYPIAIYCSTAEVTPAMWERLNEMLKYQHTQYIWTDSTWVWHG